MSVRFSTVCSGIGAPEVAVANIGWRQVFCSEIEPFPKAVLATRFPGVPDLGDLTQVDGSAWRGKIDVIIGGTPCQAFSVAGKRNGLSDARGNLTLTFVELCDAINPSVVLWENVPGVLSSQDNAFGCFLSGLAGWNDEISPPGGRWANAGAVYGPRRKVAWRILDAQFFGVPQRRRRVFVVAVRAGDGIDPAEILFERAGLRWNLDEGESAWKGASEGSRGGIESTVIFNAEGGCDGEHSNALTRSNIGKQLNNQTPLVIAGFNGGQSDGGLGYEENRAPTLTRDMSGVEPTLLSGHTVRRLTPRECERLQGFPDDWTQIPWRGNPAEKCPDGHRYKACGNSMAVPVVKWICTRIDSALNMIKHHKET